MSRKRMAIEAEILRAAADMFSERGYQATTLDEIAAQAGIGRASFYSYFPNKEELLRRIYNQVISSTQAALGRIAAEDLPTPDKLRRIIRYQIGYLADHKPLVQVFFSELVNLPREMARSVAHANRAFRQVIEHVVADGVQKGELIALHPRRVTYALIGMCNWTHRWYQPGGEWTPDTVAEEIIRILESGYLVQSAEADYALLLREVRTLRQEVHQLQSALAPQTAPLRQPGKRPSRKRSTRAAG